jgi:hypothetical protein
MTATHEFVVPKSIPITFLMLFKGLIICLFLTLRQVNLYAMHLMAEKMAEITNGMKIS